jgi:hypothetical protein
VNRPCRPRADRRGPQTGHRSVVSWARADRLPGALHTQRPRQSPEGLRGDVRRRDPHRVAQPDGPHVRRRLEEVADMLARQLPTSRRCCATRVKVCSPSPAFPLVHRRKTGRPTTRAGQRRDQTTHQRSGDLPQRQRRPTADHRPAGQDLRRMACRRTPLPLRRIPRPRSANPSPPSRRCPRPPPPDTLTTSNVDDQNDERSTCAAPRARPDRPLRRTTKPRTQRCTGSVQRLTGTR